MIVVDSTVWIGQLRGSDRAAVRYLEAIERPTGTVVVGDIILLEVLRGARDDQHALRLQNTFRRFRFVNMLDAELAVAAAGHYRQLRHSGITVGKLADLVIATYCLRHGHELLHDDQDFAPLVRHLGLRVVT